MDTKVGVGDRSLTPCHTHGYIWFHSCSRIFGKAAWRWKGGHGWKDSIQSM